MNHNLTLWERQWLDSQGVELPAEDVRGDWIAVLGLAGVCVVVAVAWGLV